MTGRLPRSSVSDRDYSPRAAAILLSGSIGATAVSPAASPSVISASSPASRETSPAAARALPCDGMRPSMTFARLPIGRTALLGSAAPALPSEWRRPSSAFARVPISGIASAERPKRSGGFGVPAISPAPANSGVWPDGSLAGSRVPAGLPMARSSCLASRCSNVSPGGGGVWWISHSRAANCTGVCGDPALSGLASEKWRVPGEQ
jgi:hypothetical protein